MVSSGRRMAWTADTRIKKSSGEVPHVQMFESDSKILNTSPTVSFAGRINRGQRKESWTYIGSKWSGEYSVRLIIHGHHRWTQYKICTFRVQSKVVDISPTVSVCVSVVGRINHQQRKRVRQTQFEYVHSEVFDISLTLWLFLEMPVT